MARQTVSLLTDYGAGNGFVGSLHAVIAQLAPGTTVIDLDHSVPPFDVRAGAARLERFLPVLPEGVTVGVVDPGVGGERRPILIDVGSHLFVGPDNGLLVWAAARWRSAARVFLLDRPQFWRPAPSVTFDGRDVFAPIAAHLVLGLPSEELGSELGFDQLVELPRPVASFESGGLVAEVIDIDRFGNVALGAGEQELARAGLRGHLVEIDVAGAKNTAVGGRAFSDVEQGGLLVYLDSAGWASIAVNQGNAADFLGVTRGDAVRMAPLGSTS